MKASREEALTRISCCHDEGMNANSSIMHETISLLRCDHSTTQNNLSTSAASQMLACTKPRRRKVVTFDSTSHIFEVPRTDCPKERRAGWYSAMEQKVLKMRTRNIMLKMSRGAISVDDECTYGLDSCSILKRKVSNYFQIRRKILQK